MQDPDLTPTPRIEVEVVSATNLGTQRSDQLLIALD